MLTVLSALLAAFTVVATPQKAVPVLVDPSDYAVVAKAAGMLSEDISMVTGSRPEVVYSIPPRERTLIIAGTLDKSRFVNELVSRGKIDASPLEGQWEKYLMTTVKNPFPGVSRAVVVAGSDRRGTAYGLLSISESLGVSPWVWWADVPYPHRDKLAIPDGTVLSKSPSVKYRGIFINDEDWGLLPWASNTYDPGTGNIGPRTYARVCELMLRLKANYLCPAMHRRSMAFNENQANKAVADSFAIVMGSVHCEPLLYNNAREWNASEQGPWNYETNGETIRSVLRKRVRENGRYENVYTLALRGLHDKAMEGSGSMEERKALLEQALQDQRKILQEELGVPAGTVPQAFTPYKEVLDLYNRGLNLPEDVTLIWPDDNYGYMKQLSSPAERKRPGRSGVYYHVSYHGKPHDYLWFATTSPALMLEELDKAYRTGADRIWLLNAGDIKLCEYAVDLFCRMAWDMSTFDLSTVAGDPGEWLSGIFGHREVLDTLSREFFDLSFQCKPEYMGWGQEWNTRYDKQAKLTDTDWSFTSYREADRRLARFGNMMDRADSLLTELPERYKSAFYELVYYPVAGSALMNRMHLQAQRSRLYARQGRASALSYARDAVRCHAALDSLTLCYNRLLDGKWNGIASMKQGVTAHYFEIPPLPDSSTGSGGIDIAVEGEALVEPRPRFRVLPTFNPLIPREYTFDVFSMGGRPEEWSLTCSDPWIRVDRTAGNSSADVTVTVSVDFSGLGPGSHGGEILVKSPSVSRTVLVTAFVPAGRMPDGDMFVEDNGVVSMPAGMYSRKTERNGTGFRLIPGLGIEGSSVQIGDPLGEPRDLRDTVSYLAYDFWSFNSGQVDVYTYVLPTFPICRKDTFMSDFAGVDPLSQELKYGLSIDDVLVAAPSIPTTEYSQSWTEGVLRNCNIRKTTLNVAAPGKHTLKVLCGDPGVVLQKIVIDFGGMKRSFLGPPSTFVPAGGDSLHPGRPVTATAVGGILGNLLERTRHGRVDTFITGADSPAVQLFAEENQTDRIRSWRGEHVGKWLCAASALYSHTGDIRIRGRIKEVADWLIGRQGPDGYLGYYKEGFRFYNAGIGQGWDVWINAYNMKGLVAAYKALEDERYLQAASKISECMYDAFVVNRLPFCETGFHGGLVATGTIEPLCDLYREKRDVHVKAMIDLCMAQMESFPGLGLLSTFTEGRDAQSVGNGKIYEMLRNLTGLASYAELTGDVKLAGICRNAWNNIRDSHLSPSGTPWGGVDVNNEVFNPKGFFAPSQVCETCSTMEWLHFTKAMLELDGSPVYAEEMEKTLYNALPGASGGIGSEWVYYTRLNGPVHRGNEWSCCWSSGMMAAEDIPGLLWSVTGDSVRADVYCPSSLETVLDSGERVEIVQGGDYAHEGEVRFQIRSDFGAALMLRLPEWCGGNYRCMLNGTPVAPGFNGGWLVLKRRWKAGDVLELSFPVEERMVSRISDTDHERWTCTYRGPLLMGRPAEGESTPLPMYELPWKSTADGFEYWQKAG